MRRFRRRSKLMPAVQFDGTREGLLLLVAFSPCVVAEADGSNVQLATDRGMTPVQQGDWLVRDPDLDQVAVMSNRQFFATFDCVGQG